MKFERNLMGRYSREKWFQWLSPKWLYASRWKEHVIHIMLSNPLWCLNSLSYWLENEVFFFLFVFSFIVFQYPFLSTFNVSFLMFYCGCYCCWYFCVSLEGLLYTCKAVNENIITNIRCAIYNIAYVLKRSKIPFTVDIK